MLFFCFQNVPETLKLENREDDFDIKLENIDLHFDLGNESSLSLDSE